MMLKDKVAIVTGAASGIGKGIAARFCREGAKVAIADIDLGAAQRAARQLGPRAFPVLVDVSAKASVTDMVRTAQKRLGPVDILVNNAGISEVTPFLDLDESRWARHLDINLKGAFFCSQAVLKDMTRRKKGKIINISSQSGKQGNSQYQAYCASKFGLVGLTQSLAVEFASYGITINAICPGVAFTPLWKKMLPAYAAKRNMDESQVRAWLESRIPLGRLCTPQDVAGVAAFLASRDGDYLTGQAINVNGGSLMQ
jgi:NAD(P)-dependent dehydrogenase (short-subunit alcohol dehydrogenase family)